MLRRNAAYAAGLVLACVLAVILGLVIGNQGPTADQVRATVRDALVRNCENDRKFRLQYRKRAIAERQMFRIEARANEAIIDVAEEASATAPTSSSITTLDDRLDRLNQRLVDLRASIRIHPVPACAELRAVVEQLTVPEQ